MTFSPCEITRIINVMQLKKAICCGFKRNNKIHVNSKIYTKNLISPCFPSEKNYVYIIGEWIKMLSRSPSLYKLLQKTREYVVTTWMTKQKVGTTVNLTAIIIDYFFQNYWSGRISFFSLFFFSSRMPIMPNLIQLNRNYLEA